MSAPCWDGDAAGGASVAVSFDLAQDLAVERCGEGHASPSAGEEWYRVESLFVEVVCAGDLVAQELFAGAW